MPIESKECFSSLTIDGQLYEIYQAAQGGGGGGGFPTGTGLVKVVGGVVQSPATTIVNADISATAAIDQSKILNLTTDLAAKASITDSIVNALIFG